MRAHTRIIFQRISLSLFLFFFFGSGHYLQAGKLQQRSAVKELFLLFDKKQGWQEVRQRFYSNSHLPSAGQPESNMKSSYFFLVVLVLCGNRGLFVLTRVAIAVAHAQYYRFDPFTAIWSTTKNTDFIYRCLSFQLAADAAGYAAHTHTQRMH